MIVVLNGPLGIGKSTLGEAFTERLESCVLLEGDRLLAMNPPVADEMAFLHATIVLLIEHYRSFGYRHFVIDHFWQSSAELADLESRVAAATPGEVIRVFLLTLPVEENLRRIDVRQAARATNEREFELRTVREERAILADRTDLGEPLDVSAALSELVDQLRVRLGV